MYSCLLGNIMQLWPVAAISSRQWGDDMAKSGNCWGDACICVPPTKIFWGDASPRPPYNRRPWLWLYRVFSQLLLRACLQITASTSICMHGMTEHNGIVVIVTTSRQVSCHVRAVLWCACPTRVRSTAAAAMMRLVQRYGV